MTRKLLPLALVLGSVAAACAEPPNAQIDFGSGTRFVPLVADSLNDAGVDPSIVVDRDGRPVVAYFGFPEEVPEGELQAARPVGAPSIPGVLMATASEEGLWTRGAVALEQQIPNVQVPFNPAFEPSVADLTKDSVTGLQIVAAPEDFHAVWGSADGLFYATGSLAADAGSPVEVTRVSDTPPVGPSIAVDGDGTPWVAFYTSTSTAASVELATPSGDRWSVETVADAGGCDTCRTAVVAGRDVGVAYSDGGSGVSFAMNDGENGWVSTQVVGEGGQGLSGAAMADGFALAYYADGVVGVATGVPGAFESRPASEVAAGSETSDGAGTSIALDDQGALWLAWHDAGTGVGFATGDGQDFAPIDTGADTSDGTMPSVAVTPDGAIAYVAWYDPGTQDLLVGAYGDLTGLAIAGRPGGESPAPTGPTGATGPTTAPPAPCEPDGTALSVVAPVGASATGFDTECLAVPAGEPFTIAFDNQDAGIQHNVAIFSADPLEDPAAETFFQGEIITGVAQVTYEVDALEAGTWFFRCDIHPTTMTGTFVVGSGGGGAGDGGEDGGGAGAGAITVTAANLAFDTAEIRLAANQESVITFVNDDGGVQHNIAIFRDDSLSEELFNGELIAGPAQIDYTIPALEPGEYYFLCIVHPNMNGTVIVE
ncbi:MAG TPA: cupredoxin domain-containing protein [Actinomycetota bacterium]